MEVETTIKTILKDQRLTQLKKRYFELELDKTALEANGDIDGVQATLKRMDAVQKAYEAIYSLDVE